MNMGYNENNKKEMFNMNTMVKVILAFATIGWIYGTGKDAGKKEVLDKMKMFAEGAKYAEDKTKVED